MTWRMPLFLALVLSAACGRTHEGGAAPDHETPADATVPGLETQVAERIPVRDTRLAPGVVMGDAEPPDVRDARRALVEATARARAATQQAARLESLAQGAIAPRRELEAARAEAASAEAVAERARQTLAAFGTTAVQQPLGSGERWVLAQIPQRDVALIAPGSPVVFRVDTFPGREFAGVIDAPASYVDAATRTAPVRMRVADTVRELRPGMSGALAFTVGDARDAVAVPLGAVVYDGAQPVVFTVAGQGHFAPHPVRLGVVSGDRVEIVDGVEAGAAVVTTGAASLLSSTRLPTEAD